MMVLGCALVFSMGFVLPSTYAMTPEEILKKSDEARGNADGIEWEIAMDSIESGREQQRTLRVSARSFNSLAEFLARPMSRDKRCSW